MIPRGRSNETPRQRAGAFSFASVTLENARTRTDVRHRRRRRAGRRRLDIRAEVRRHARGRRGNVAQRRSLVTRNGRDKRAQFPEIAARAAATSRARGTIARPRRRDRRAGAREGRRRSRRCKSRLHRSTRTSTTIVKRIAARRSCCSTCCATDAPTSCGARWPSVATRLEALVDGRRSDNSIERIVIVGASECSARRGAAAGKASSRSDATRATCPAPRSRDWLKLKLQHRAEFVVGGYTDPRRSREHFGALLLGYFDASGRSVLCGQHGRRLQSRIACATSRRRLARLGAPASPFADGGQNQRAARTGCAPKLVVEVKFAEWTADGKLRQPIFLGRARRQGARRTCTANAESVQQWAQEI